MFPLLYLSYELPSYIQIIRKENLKRKQKIVNKN